MHSIQKDLVRLVAGRWTRDHAPDQPHSDQIAIGCLGKVNDFILHVLPTTNAVRADSCVKSEESELEEDEREGKGCGCN